MMTIRVALHSLVLVFADLAGIGFGGMAAYKLLGVPNQVWVQLPLAIMISVVAFCGWIICLRLLQWRRVQLACSKERRICLAASLAWAPLVFVPLHYITQGYLTSLGNIVVLALYQLPVNALALVCSSQLLPKPLFCAASAQPLPPDGSPATGTAGTSSEVDH